MGLFGDYAPDPWDYDNDEPDLRSPPKCGRCGVVCSWHNTGTRWALMKDGRLHDCRSSGASPDAFDVFDDAAPT